MTWTEKILDFLFRYLSVFTDKKLLAAEGAAHFCLDKDFYYIEDVQTDVFLVFSLSFFKVVAICFGIV